jgi:hypothetical protein
VNDFEPAGERLHDLPPSEQDGRDLGGGRLESACDDLFRGPIAAHGVDGDPDRSH